MLILHAGFVDEVFLLWGETPAGASRTEVGSRAFPYDAGAKHLKEALRAMGLPVTRVPVRPAYVWLPTWRGRPLASSPLIASSPAGRARPRLEAWGVIALHLAPEQVVALLGAVGGKELLAPGVLAGADLQFWFRALRFAAALVTRQQFVPGVASHEEGFAARWQPLFAGAEAAELASLAAALPAVGRALGESDAAPETSPREVTHGFVAMLTDHLVRASLPAAPRRAGFDSLHEQWLYALRAGDGKLVGAPSELASFAGEVRAWQRPVTLASAAPFRLCFRIEEPEETEEEDASPTSWRVRYRLQATDDPSLLVPVERVWEGDSEEAALLRRGGFLAHEYLLTALGQASRVSPQVEASLTSAAPAGYELDAAGAHAFLTEQAPVLEQAGFGVMLPAWWTRRGVRLRLTARAGVKSPRLKSAGGLTLEEAVRFDWQLALEGEPITLEELEALARLKAPLVKLRGRWVEVNAQDLREALSLWRRREQAQGTLRDVVQLALGAGGGTGPIDFEGVTASGWIGDFLATLQGSSQLEELAAPAGFRGALRPYQARGYSWLHFLHRWGLGACLADDMGLGKTIQTLALLQRDWESNGHRPSLLICPTSVVRNWQKEAARFTPELPVLIHHGVTRHRDEQLRGEAERHALVISSYALLHRDFEALKSVPWSGIVLDEAQNVKNPETRQARAARGLPADYRIALTGTPVENSVGDLWSIMEFLNPGFLGNQAEFKRRFLVPIQAYHDAGASARLRRLTQPFVLRRVKTDPTVISDLPEKQEMKVFCTLTKEQASLYAAVVDEVTGALEETEGMERRGLVLATLLKLKQICNHPAQFLGDNSAIPGRSVKLSRLTEMLEEVLAVDDRALIFSQFVEMGGILQAHLQESFGEEVLFLHGSVPRKQRDTLVERFQEGGGPHLLLLSLKAGGTGLNLTRANHVFHYDRWWNPAVENQATDRAFRIGQTRDVQVHKFLCVGTVEEKIDEMITRKQEVAEQVVGAGERWLTELSTDELRELFTLGQEAVAE